MNVFPVNISAQGDMKAVCEKIGTDVRALGYLVPKSRFFHFYADDVDFRAAGFIKQEMLARGGDAAVTKHVIDGKAERSDILIMCTGSQLRSFQEKLKAMDCWGLREFREKLSSAVVGLNTQAWTMKSPAGHEIALSLNTKLMGILNVTPDSFFAGSRVDEAGIVSRAEAMLNEGAYILDVGAESTRPGAMPVSGEEELGRLLPALRVLRKSFPEAVISVDTYKPETARIAVGEGADIINDVMFSAEMAETVRVLKVPYVLTHNGSDSVGGMVKFFAERLAVLEGVEVIIDPGLGFGKEKADNFAVLKDIESLRIFGRPVLVGHSRKRLTGGSLAGTLGVSALMAGKVSLLRVHDVKENAEAVRMAEVISGL